MMLSSVLKYPEVPAEELLRPEPLADGAQPEERLVVCGVSWNRYLAFDKALGDDRPSPRLYYFDRELEIMTTSNEHERVKKWIAGFLEIYFEHLGIEVIPRGQATMRLDPKEVGAEPDESWCMHQDKPYPDLVLEIDWTHSALNRLRIYAVLRVPEIWQFDGQSLRIHLLGSDGKYAESAQSRAFPFLPLSDVTRFLGMRADLSETDLVRQFRSWVRERIAAGWQE